MVVAEDKAALAVDGGTRIPAGAGMVGQDMVAVADVAEVEEGASNMVAPRFEIYRDRRKEWRWRLKAANGRIIADSGEGYSRREHARRATRRLIQLIRMM